MSSLNGSFKEDTAMSSMWEFPLKYRFLLNGGEWVECEGVAYWFI